MPQENNFLYVESTMNPLQKVDEQLITKETIDPLTGKPYKGMVLEGIFACLEEVNNNNRVYDIENYIQYLNMLRTQIHSAKGVYGELEHPEGYAVNWNRVSHKILDIWYDERSKCVIGQVLILNTEKGLIAQEIIRSGGQLAISARAAGKEIKMNDGKMKAVISLLVTYDLVYHPGFGSATLNFVKLNESLNLFSPLQNNIGFAYKIYDTDFQTLNESYEHFLGLTGTENNKPYLQWFEDNIHTLNESETQEKSQQEKEDEQRLQDSQTNDEDEIQKDLEDATEQDLDEDEKLFNDEEIMQAQKAAFIHQLNIENRFKNNRQQINKKKQGASFYDGSAGFIQRKPNSAPTPQSPTSNDADVSATHNYGSPAGINDVS